MTAIAHFFQDAAGEHRFQVKGGNGEIVVTSEGYTRADDAVRGFERLRELLAAPADAAPADDAGYSLIELCVCVLVIIVLVLLIVHYLPAR